MRNGEPMRRGRHSLLLLIVAISLVGCGPETIERTYGRRRGPEGASSSVNGTIVFAGMLREAGMRVSSWSRLSPKLDAADAVIWFPDDFGPPTAEQRRFLERWLRKERRRTLVYVGRDFDAAVSYWRQVAPQTPPEQKVEVDRRLALAESDHASRRFKMPAEADEDWFIMRRDPVAEPEGVLGGPWSQGVNGAAARIEVEGLLLPPEDKLATVLLEQAEVPIVYRLSDATFGDGQVIVVANGSFLLNLPLVNREHRKLAARLIEELEPAERVVLLESGEGGPPLIARDPDENYPTGLEIFTVWPLGFLMLHVAIAGLTLCIACFPIFGRAQEPRTTSTSDFGQHIDALGELLAKSEDRQYAVDRLTYYHENVRGSERHG